MVGVFKGRLDASFIQAGLWAGLISIFTSLIAVFVTYQVMIQALDRLVPSLLITAAILPIILAAPIAAIAAWRQHHLIASNRRLFDLAYRDSMLGCMNRRGFVAATDIALKYADAGRPCSLLVIDADNFKLINDRFGHIAGDKALQLITETIRESIRTSDLMGRIGGEEFAVFLPATRAEAARRVAGRIREKVALSVFEPEGRRYPISVSIGGAVACEPSNFSTLFKAADIQLYAAKHQGRNKVAFEGFLEREDIASEVSEPGRDVA